MFTFMDNVVRSTTRLNGETTFKGNTKIAGTVEGVVLMDASATLLIASGGFVRCESLTAKTIVVSGELHATHITAERIVLRKGARVHGKITAQTVEIQASAQYDGQISIVTPKTVPQNTSAHQAKQRLEAVTGA